MPQTRESIQILQHEKTPFAVALTKIDLIAGWRKPVGPTSLRAQLEKCGPEYVRALDARLYGIAEELLQAGFSAERYDRVSDFTRNVGIVPVSAKTGAGVPELIALLVGLSQRFLKGEITLVTEGGEATILERSEAKGVGPVGNIILYSGTLHAGEEVAVTGRQGPFVTHIRGLFRPAAAARGKASRTPRLESVGEVSAAAGLFVAAPGIENALPGGLLKVVGQDAEREAVLAELQQASQPVSELAESGVAIAADTLGGLEALAYECHQSSIPIHEATVGPVGRPTILRMADVRDPVHRAVLAFNVPVLPEAQPERETATVRVFRGEIMYRLLEEYGGWRDELQSRLAARRRLETVHPAKLEVLRGFVFRHSKPAIVGVKVVAGRLRPGVRLMHLDGGEVGVLKSLQKENSSVPEAAPGEELAASIDGAVVGRNLSEGDSLFVLLPESAVRVLLRTELAPEEREILDEIVKRRRQVEPFWGQ
jgi:translation initiation factor 5B